MELRPLICIHPLKCLDKQTTRKAQTVKKKERKKSFIPLNKKRDRNKEEKNGLMETIQFRRYGSISAAMLIRCCCLLEITSSTVWLVVCLLFSYFLFYFVKKSGMMRTDTSRCGFQTRLLSL